MTSLGDPIYLDTSAVVKLIVDEPESVALRSFLGSIEGQLTTSVVTEIACLRAVARVDPDWRPAASGLLQSFLLLPLTDSMRLRAAYLHPTSLRSLDAIQLATALEVQASISHFVSYDTRQSEVAGNFGLAVETPI